MCKLLIARGADCSRRVEGETALHLAIRTSRDNDLYEALLQSGAPQNAVNTCENNDGSSPLLLACMCRRGRQLCTLLLRQGADVNLANRYGETPLMDAVRGEEEDLCKLFLQHGAEVNTREVRHGLTPLTIAVEKRNMTICEILLDSGAEVLWDDRGKWMHAQALKYAAQISARTRDFRIFDLLLRHAAHREYLRGRRMASRQRPLLRF